MKYSGQLQQKESVTHKFTSGSVPPPLSLSTHTHTQFQAQNELVCVCHYV
jgi:DNA-nicking Smr family endonuclease